MSFSGEVQKGYEDFDKESDGSEAENEASISDIAHKESRIKELEDENSCNEKKLEIFKMKCSTLEEQLLQYRQEHSSIEDRLKREIETAMNEIARKESRIKELEDENSSYEKNVEVLKGKCSTLEEQLLQYRQEYSAIEDKLKKENQATMNDVAQKEKRIKELEDENSSHEKNVEVLKGKCSALEELFLQYRQQYSIVTDQLKKGCNSYEIQIMHLKESLLNIKEEVESLVQKGTEYVQQAGSSSLKADKQEMITIQHSGCEDKERVKELMDNTFSHRRNFIIEEHPFVVSVKEEFPLLFSYEEIKNEMKRIFVPDICERFISRMQKTAEVIVKEMSEKNSVYIKIIEEAQTDLSKMYATAVGSIFILSKYLKENCCFIQPCDKDFPGCYPHISAPLSSMKELFFNRMTFNIIVEKQKVCEAPNLLEAVMCLMGVYFIFNIHYPEQYVRTFTVFEKLFLGANDTLEIDHETYECLKNLQLKTSIGVSLKGVSISPGLSREDSKRACKTFNSQKNI